MMCSQFVRFQSMTMNYLILMINFQSITKLYCHSMHYRPRVVIFNKVRLENEKFTVNWLPSRKGIATSNLLGSEKDDLRVSDFPRVIRAGVFEWTQFIRIVFIQFIMLNSNFGKFTIMPIQIMKICKINSPMTQI